MTDVVGSPGWSITPVQAEVAYHNCQLCGRRGPTPTADDNVAMWAGRMERWPDAVSMTLVHWFDPLPGKEWTQEYICEDRDACYRVVTDFGETWNIRDGRPRRPARSAMADEVIAALGLPTDEEQAEVGPLLGHGVSTQDPTVTETSGRGSHVGPIRRVDVADDLDVRVGPGARALALVVDTNMDGPGDQESTSAQAHRRQEETSELLHAVRVAAAHEDDDAGELDWGLGA